MRDVTVAPKLAALKDLLTQCGVIGEGGEDGTSGGEMDSLHWVESYKLLIHTGH